MGSGALPFGQRLPSVFPYPRYMRCGNGPASPPLQRERLSLLLPDLAFLRGGKRHIPGETEGDFQGVLDHADDKADACRLHKQFAISVRTRIKI